MKYRSVFVVVITLSGLALVPGSWTTPVSAQEPAAASTTAQEDPKPKDAAEKPAEPSAEKPSAEKPSAEKPSQEKPAELAKVVDSNQQATNQQRDVSRTAGMIAGVSLLIVLAYVLTRKKAKPTNG